jgi:ubiquitin carboxyl-terminal hydrolase BAP1
MNKGWLELESDPGVFTLLVEDFGVQGVQVEEIYDLQKPIEGPVYGFIFLFRWIEERRSRRKVTQEDESFVVDDKIINSMFFARQVIANSCATHALLSILLNCENKIKLGDMLTRLKHFTKDMNPEDKGYAISNMPDLAKAHNSHARPEPCRLPEKQQGISAGRIQEAFHFVSYVPINGHLFELDGLKPYPIDHGPGEENGDWTAKFCKVISERIGTATGGEPYHDIRYALMAVVPDKRLQYEQKLKMLKTNRRTIVEALRQAQTSKDGSPCPTKGRRRSSAASSSQSGQTADLSWNSEQMMQQQTSGCVGLPPSVAVMPGVPNKMDSDGISQPLTIQTSFSASLTVADAPLSSGSTTDTASEVASLIHSPGDLSSLGSTTDNSIDGLTTVVPMQRGSDDETTLDDGSAKVTVASDLDKRLATATAQHAVVTKNSSGSVGVNEELVVKVDCGGGNDDGDPSKMKNGQKSPTRFSAKELAQLLKEVDGEILSCENSQKDEIEKRKKYKIDDCRRTHNYDQFICTFLSMLAEQGQLAGLVEQHMLTKRRQGSSVGRLHHRVSKAVDKRKRIRHKR